MVEKRITERQERVLRHLDAQIGDIPLYSHDRNVGWRLVDAGLAYAQPLDHFSITDAGRAYLRALPVRVVG